jgi:hypothetical protein
MKRYGSGDKAPRTVNFSMSKRSVLRSSDLRQGREPALHMKQHIVTLIRNDSVSNCRYFSGHEFN